MNIDRIIEFLKTDIRGLIILGILTSIIAALFYDIIKKQILKSIKYWQRKKRINRLTQHLKNYTDGFTAGYAHTSSYRQIALVGEFIIRTVVKVGWLLFSTLVFTSLLILVEQPFSWILVILYAVVITVQYRRLRDYLKDYNLFEETIFGKEFKEKVSEALDGYIDEKFKGHKQSNENP